MIAGDEETGCAVATVACCTSLVYKLENIRLHTVRLVPFTDTKFTQKDKTWKKKNTWDFFFSFIGTTTKKKNTGRQLLFRFMLK